MMLVHAPLEALFETVKTETMYRRTRSGGKLMQLDGSLWSQVCTGEVLPQCQFVKWYVKQSLKRKASRVESMVMRGRQGRLEGGLITRW
jgi:hypothetical protein